MRELTIYALITLYLLCVNGLQFQILNDVLRDRRYDEELAFKLNFNHHVLYDDELSNAVLCVTKNGMKCHCSKEPLHSARLYLTSACVSETEGFWFSLSIALSSGRVIAATPYYVSPALPLIPNEEQQGELPKSRLTISQQLSMLTLVLPTTLSDWARCVTLLQSLALMGTDVVFEMLIFVPAHQQDNIQVSASLCVNAIAVVK